MPSITPPKSSATPSDSVNRSAAWTNILKLPKSPAVTAVVRYCETLARELDVANGVTSTVLLRAIAAAGRTDEAARSGSAVARFASLLGQVKEFESVMAEYINVRTKQRRKAASLSQQLQVSVNVGTIFREAMELAKAEGFGPDLEGRHLMVAFFDFGEQERSVGAWKALERMGLNRRALRDNLVRNLTGVVALGPVARSFWAGKLPVATDTPPGQVATRFLPSFDSDDPAGTDRLGFGADVEAMAALIASKSVEPPLSIGVFGDWGSGKSFFVHKLAQRVQGLGREDPGLFWANVVVIEFNAWHYADSNLWASLVAHVFDQLRSHSKKRTGGLETKLKDLALAQAVHAEAKLNEIAAQERLAAAQANEGKIKQTLEGKRIELAANVAKDLWAQLQSSYASDQNVTAAVGRFQEIKLGTADIGGDLHALYTRAQEATTTVGRMKLISLNLLRGESTGKLVGGFVGATVVAVGLGAALYHWVTPQNVAAVIAALTQVGGTALAGIWWMRDNTKKVLTALEPVEKARAFIEGHLRAAEKAQAEITTRLEAEIVQELVAFKQATQEEADARRKLEEAQQAVRREVSGELIRRFVEERAGSGDYAKHLGLIAMIRDDFGKLSDMLAEHNANRESAAALNVTDVGINRIVLVIDDLDRCPPARVVEVLEAVFLLLAFPAFVVVVAVDSRWVSHSLLHTYEHLLQKTSLSEENEAEGRATPRDYLEKIFQIPYRVRRMNDAGYVLMIDALTGGGSSDPVAEQPVTGAGRSPADPNLLAGAVIPGVSQAAAAVAGATLPIKEVARPTLQAMRLTPGEVTAMKQLSSIVGRSPRATKRFVNIYRLLKAALPPEQLLRFEAEEFRVAMLLLAIVHSARPASGPLNEAEFVQNIAALPGDFRSEWAPTVTQLSGWTDRIRQFSFED